MRILLQQISSGKFLDADDHWTDDETKAKVFEHFLEAFAYARDTLSEPVSAFCAFLDPRYNFSVYLRSAKAAAEWQSKVEPIEWLDNLQLQQQRN